MMHIFVWEFEGFSDRKTEEDSAWKWVAPSHNQNLKKKKKKGDRSKPNEPWDAHCLLLGAKG